MPTAEEYAFAYGVFKEYYDLVYIEIDRVDVSWDDAIWSGPLKATVDRAVRASVENLEWVLARLQMVSSECERRQAVCEQYDRDMMAYRLQLRAYNNDPSRRSFPAPVAPPQPAPWATPSVLV